MARLTKREKIIQYLKDSGIDLWWLRYEEIKDQWQKPGTIVISGYGTDRFYKIDTLARTEKKIKVNQIRDKFEWKYAYRIQWIGD